MDSKSFKVSVAIIVVVVFSLANDVSSFEYNKINGSWRVYPSSSINAPSFRIAGKINNPPVKKFNTIPDSSIRSAEKIVSDQIFLLTQKGATYNIWTVLERLEGRFAISEIPYTYCNKNNASLNYAKQIYGEPDHVSWFIFPDNKKQELYWWGPIFLMFVNDQIFQIGGWPSRIGKDKKSSASILPPYDYEIVPGNNLVRIDNSNRHGATIGIRSLDACKYTVGIDSYLDPPDVSVVNLPPGDYDVYLVFSNKPKALFQGHLLKIKPSDAMDGAKTTEIAIRLVESVDGNYPLKQIK